MEENETDEAQGYSESREGEPDIDAMGKDKRRGVVGGQYGATKRKQLTVYGIFLAVLAVVAIGGLTVVKGIDNREMPLEETGPWTEATALTEPRDVDFPDNGPDNTIPAQQIGKAPGPVSSDRETQGTPSNP